MRATLRLGTRSLGLALVLLSAQAAAADPATRTSDAGTRSAPTGSRAAGGATRTSDAGSRATTAGSRAAEAGRTGDAGPRAADAGPRASNLVSTSKESAERELVAVLSELARTEALSARFREEKRMSLLAQPLFSEGTLHYEKPRQLARHTERPRKSSLLLQNDMLTFGDAQHSESMGLAAQPALRVLVDTFVSVLAGDRAALERIAEVVLEPGRDGGFRIRVTPRDAGVKRLVRTMAFEGKGALLSRMELLDANGDSTLTTFSDVKLRKRFSAAERTRLFHIGG